MKHLEDAGRLSRGLYEGQLGERGQPGSAYKGPCAHPKDLMKHLEDAGRLSRGLYEGQLGERGTQGGRDHPEESWKLGGQLTCPRQALPHGQEHQIQLEGPGASGRSRWRAVSGEE